MKTQVMNSGLQGVQDLSAGKSTRAVKADLLILMMIVGSLGAPLIGPLREQMQLALGISRAGLGLGIFAMGLSAGILSFLAVTRFSHIPRTTYIRCGALLMIAGMMVMFLVTPSPGISALFLAGGWFLLLAGGTLAGLSNALVMDLWKDSPGTGVILLHGTNALGKVLAPLLVFMIGTRLSGNALVYLAMLVLLFLHMLTWPRSAAHEPAGTQQASTGKRTGFFWLAAAPFALISGSEAGTVSILGSFITASRPSPVAGMEPQTWAALLIIILQCGIVTGRFLFVWLSRRVPERTIIGICVLFALCIIPGVLVKNPAGYIGAFYLTGIAFSATWPAYFALAGKYFSANRSSFAVAARLFSITGINGCILLTSVIGNTNRMLPAAAAVSTLLIGGVAVFLYLTPAGRRLR